MIKEPIETFKLMFKEYGDDLIYETRVLKKGTYVIVDSDKENYEMFNIEGENDVVSPSKYKELAKMDYLSSLITTDKSVDPKKTIHSNNYMTFFIKKNHVISSEDNKKRTKKKQSKDYQLVLNTVDRYYNAIQKIIPENDKKKADREILAVLKSSGTQLLDIDMEKLEKNKSWIKENILKLKDNIEYRDDDNYLKIFFIDSEDRYINESSRYMIPKLYNSNDYNTYVNDILYGLPGDNMQLNPKKPSLKQMTRKNYCPILLTLEDALIQYKFFSYLENLSSRGENVLYVNDEGFYTYEQIKDRRDSFNGYLLRLKRDKTLNLVDFKVLMGYKPKQLKEKFNFENILEATEYEDSNIEYGAKTALFEIYSLVDEIIFYKMLKTNIFNDKIKIKNQDIKKLTELTRDNMFNWFYQGKEREGYMALKRIFVDILKNSIYQGYFNKAKTQFNLLYSLMLYYENGGNSMPNTIKDVREQMIEKLNLNCDKDEIQYIDNDEQYYYSVGQLVKYLLSLKNSSKVNQTEINSMLNSRNDKRLKSEVERLYKRYNHSKYINSKKFNALYAMVLSYNPNNSKQDSISLLAGFLGVSILKNNKNEENSNESN